VFKSVLLLCLGVTSLQLAAQTVPPKVAIIIDDIGYQKTDAALIQLPHALTFAVMPFAPHGHEMAVLAQSHRKEVMLHMPMEAVALNHLLGKGALRRGMDKATVQQTIRSAFDNVPQAVGINNHMGSLFTSLPQQMDWAMQVVAERNKYFVDSKTTPKSVGIALSKQYQVRHRSRDVFLDNNKSYRALDQQFTDLMQIAKQHGSAVGIGHPYPETLSYLKKNLPRLKAAGIELVPVSALLDLPEHNKPYIATQPVTPSKTTPVTKPVTATTAPATTPTSEHEQQLPVEEVVTPAELLPWRVPYRLDAPGLLEPSAPEVEQTAAEHFSVPTSTIEPMPAAMHLLMR
jgi:polysaccharide deacetylase 2 family uncharacterized protein YibQ